MQAVRLEESHERLTHRCPLRAACVTKFKPRRSSTSRVQSMPGGNTCRRHFVKNWATSNSTIVLCKQGCVPVKLQASMAPRLTHVWAVVLFPSATCQKIHTIRARHITLRRARCHENTTSSTFPLATDFWCWYWYWYSEGNYRFSRDRQCFQISLCPKWRGGLRYLEQLQSLL